MHFLDPWKIFLGLDQVQKLFCGPTYVDNEPWFLEVQPYIFVFNSATFGASFALFWGPLGLFFVLWVIFVFGTSSKIFSEPTNVDYQFWFGVRLKIFFGTYLYI